MTHRGPDRGRPLLSTFFSQLEVLNLTNMHRITCFMEHFERDILPLEPDFKLNLDELSEGIFRG